jgi:hypothetical protein
LFFKAKRMQQLTNMHDGATCHHSGTDEFLLLFSFFLAATSAATDANKGVVDSNALPPNI